MCFLLEMKWMIREGEIELTRDRNARTLHKITIREEGEKKIEADFGLSSFHFNIFSHVITFSL